MHTCTLCTSSIACESFWSASRIKSVSLWMMTSSWPCSSRGWLRSSCGDQDIGVLKAATADAQEYDYSQRFTSHYELNYYSFKKKTKKNTHPLLIALFIALTLVLTKFMLYLFEMTTLGYIYRVLQCESKSLPHPPKSPWAYLTAANKRGHICLKCTSCETQEVQIWSSHLCHVATC